MRAVITYIFGNAELLREPLVVDPMVEYICVTDNDKLRSKYYKFIYEPVDQNMRLRDKMAYVKYNPFRYTTANQIVLLDGSCQIIHSLQPLFHTLTTYNIVCKKHPVRTNLYDELNEWTKYRNMPLCVVDKFKSMSAIDGINLTDNGLIESNIMAVNNCHFCVNLFNQVLQYMKWLGYDNHLCDTNQCVLSYLLRKYNIVPGWLTQTDFIARYLHNTWIKNTQ